ncbi:hypothetical protein [Colwellia sp. MEBiC06753]
MDLSSLSQLQNQSKESFNQQRLVIKQVLAGKVVKCQQCHQELVFHPKQQASQTVNYADNYADNYANKHADKPAAIRCANGCTDIELDIG